MNFRSATDALFDHVNHETLAKALGVSLASIRQARLQEAARGKRTPPKDWPCAVIQLAEQQIMKDRKLTEAVRKELPAAK